MPGKRKQYFPEFRKGAARMVSDSSRPITYVVRKIGVHEITLGYWVEACRTKHREDESPIEISERARLRELERENRELKMKCGFLAKGVMNT